MYIIRNPSSKELKYKPIVLLSFFVNNFTHLADTLSLSDALVRAGYFLVFYVPNKRVRVASME